MRGETGLFKVRAVKVGDTISRDGEPWHVIGKVNHAGSWVELICKHTGCSTPAPFCYDLSERVQVIG